MTSRCTRRARRAGATVALTALAAAASYPLWRKACLTWGATPAEAERPLPGDDLLPDAGLVTTRAISIAAPPGEVWPWLVQMGSGRGGAYTYDWIENLFGLDMHSANEILPEFQNLSVGDENPLGPGGKKMRVEVLDPARVLALRLEDGNWVWTFALFSDHQGTRLVSRNRIRQSGPAAVRLAYSLIMEPGSLIMERKMLLGIKERAERREARAAS